MLPYLLIPVAVLLVWLFLKRHRARQAGKAVEDEGISETARRRSPFHAVSVRVGRNACVAAKTIEGQRFLAVEAPALPLSECSNGADCECRFIHHEDGCCCGQDEPFVGDRRRTDPEDSQAG